MAGAYAGDGRWVDESPLDDARAVALPSVAASLGSAQTARPSAQTGTTTSYGPGNVTTVNCGCTNEADPTNYERFILVEDSFVLSKYNFRWLYTSDFVDTIDYYARSLRDRVLPAFDDMSEDATKAEDEAYKRYAKYAEPIDAAERALDARISFYMMAQGVVQGIMNMFTAGLYHLFEQQLIRLHRQQLLFGSEERNADLFKLKEVRQCLLRDYKIDIYTFAAWNKLEELRLVANTVKHADGDSCDKLKQRRSDLFQAPGNEHRPWPQGILARVPVYEPLSGDDLYISLDEFMKYAETTKQFWEELTQAVERLPH
jgi:hypothetical protein